MVLKFDSAAGNPARALPEWPPVVVAGGYITGVVLMRNLQHRGVDTHCIDSNPAQPAFLTKYGKAHLCPNPDLHPAEWVQFMIELSKSLGRRPVLIPSADQFVTALGTHLDELEPHFTFSRSSVENQTRLATKEQQYELAGQHGLPVPRSEFIHSLEELQRFSSTARFPCLLKPTHFREWERVPRDHPLYGQKIAMADNPAELEAKYRLACDASPLLVAQEIIEGPDTAKYAYLSCYGSNGERIGTCLVRQIRCWPIYWGSGSVVENIIDPEVDQLCDRFLRSIGYIGLCEIESIWAGSTTSI
jgi:predicted ATP-grasp superfamily ATP-dependent carboligase